MDGSEHGPLNTGEPAPVGTQVVVGVWDHKYGTDVRAFHTEERALAWRTEIADTWWEHEFQIERPAEGDLGQAYFDEIETESFSVHRVPVER